MDKNNYILEIVKIITPFIFALIIFALTKWHEQKKWRFDLFEKRRQEIYLEMWNQTQEIKSEFNWLCKDFAFNVDDYQNPCDFDTDRPKLLKRIDETFNIIDGFYIAFSKFSQYLKLINDKELDKKELNKITEVLSIVEHHLGNLGDILTIKEDGGYYYRYEDFKSRLWKVRNNCDSSIGLLDKTRLLNFLESQIIVFK